MVVLGALVNALLAVLGGVLGVFLRRYITKELGDFLLIGQGLVCVLLGVQGITAHSCNIMVITLSMGVGLLIGYLLRIEERIQCACDLLCRRVAPTPSPGRTSCDDAPAAASSQDSTSHAFFSLSSFSYGFIYASVYACTGAMSIMGSLQSGLALDHSTLYAKGCIDFVVCFALGATLGIGVPFCGISIFLYEAALSVGAMAMSAFLVGEVLGGIVIVGSLLLLVIGLNLMHITSYKVANMLPAVFLPLIFVPLVSYLAQLISCV